MKGPYSTANGIEYVDAPDDGTPHCTEHGNAWPCRICGADKAKSILKAKIGEGVPAGNMSMGDEVEGRKRTTKVPVIGRNADGVYTLSGTYYEVAV